MKSFLSFLAVALLVSMTIAGLFVAGLVFYGNREPALGGDFSLTLRGNPWRFSSEPRDLNILYIGYAKCPDICPMTLSLVGQAFRQLNDKELRDVRLLFLSVDRDNDKPDEVAEYAAQFFPEFLGLSGSREEIDKTVFLFHASYIVEKDPKSYLGYSIAHTDRLFFLDQKGQVVAMLASPKSADDILKLIKENL